MMGNHISTVGKTAENLNIGTLPLRIIDQPGKPYGQEVHKKGHSHHPEDIDKPLSGKVIKRL